MEGDRSAGKSAQKAALKSLQPPEIDNSDDEDDSLPEELEEISYEEMPSTNTAAKEKQTPKEHVPGGKNTIPLVHRTFPLPVDSGPDNDLPIDLEEFSEEDVPLAMLVRRKNNQNTAKYAKSKSTKSKTAALTPAKRQATQKESASGGKGTIRAAIRTMPALVNSPGLLRTEMDRASMAVLESSFVIQRRMQERMEQQIIVEKMHMDALSQNPPQIPLHLREQMSGGALQNMLDTQEPVPPGNARGFVSHYTEEVSPVAAHAQREMSMPAGSRDATAFQMSQDSADQEMPSENDAEQDIDHNHMEYEIPIPDSPRYP